MNDEIHQAPKNRDNEAIYMDKKQRIEELVATLNQASEAYYGGQEESMTNYEWDAMFDELMALEKETGYVLLNSPTHNTSSADQTDGKTASNKELHEYPALSLAKTKSIFDLQAWAGSRLIWLSWKLDGLTLVVTFDDGTLTKIMTRGNGTTGTNITFMKNAIRGIPLKIAYLGHFVVRGEATISYLDFEMINATIEDEDEKYANPRNLASGTLELDISNLDKVKERKITFNAFTLVHLDKPLKSWGQRMDYLDALGFTTVEREKTDAAALPDIINQWTAKVESGKMDIPVDGLVICYDDTEYAATGSVTGHHAIRAGYAFKWKDESVFTELDHIDWSCAASTITPVAVFKPVKLEGTTVTRASLCNISEMERLGIGENHHTVLEIIKANKIIPKCISAKEAEGTFSIPDECPICHEKTAIRIGKVSGTKTLYCTNPGCPAKSLKRFARFVSKPGLNIDGLSIRTLLLFVNKGIVSNFADIYQLEGHTEIIENLDGFGEKSCSNLMQAINRSKKANPINFIYALCIPMIGIDAAKKITRSIGFQGFLERMSHGERYDDIEGIGPERSDAILEWRQNPENLETLKTLLNELEIKSDDSVPAKNGKCSGLIFVITGDVHHFQNRNELKSYVETQGGTVTGSVSKKTNYLINNDIHSSSSKNKKAKELAIPILSEDDFVKMFCDHL